MRMDMDKDMDMNMYMDMDMGTCDMDMQPCMQHRMCSDRADLQRQAHADRHLHPHTAATPPGQTPSIHLTFSSHGADVGR